MRLRSVEREHESRRHLQLRRVWCALKQREICQRLEPDRQDGVCYDPETDLYWMSARTYDPTLGRFMSRDPLGRALLFFADQPYAYAGNNALVNVDPR